MKTNLTRPLVVKTEVLETPYFACRYIYKVDFMINAAIYYIYILAIQTTTTIQKKRLNTFSSLVEKNKNRTPAKCFSGLVDIM